jgi:hypothetical protein
MLRAFKKIETNKVFFVAAIIQTLKTEPEMVNLIYNIFTAANDDE